MKRKEYSKVIRYLIKQCSKPTGFIGNVMVSIWNQVFIKMALWGLSNVTIAKTDTVLEIGCGGGKFINYLANEKVGNEIYGVDISEVSIQKASRLNEKFLKTRKVFLAQGDASELVFQVEMFQKIFAIQTHIYWEGFHSAIKKIYRLLAKDGEFIIVCEKDKVRYHLPKYQEKAKMEEMLMNFGFKKITVYETENWIQYQCIKKEEYPAI